MASVLGAYYSYKWGKSGWLFISYQFRGRGGDLHHTLGGPKWGCWCRKWPKFRFSLFLSFWSKVQSEWKCGMTSFQSWFEITLIKNRKSKWTSVLRDIFFYKQNGCTLTNNYFECFVICKFIIVHIKSLTRKLFSIILSSALQRNSDGHASWKPWDRTG